MKIILASASPRRKSLMDVLGVNFEIKVSNCKETVDYSKKVEDIVMSLSLQKATDVSEQSDKDCIIIGADTVVSYKDEILGKPADRDDAVRMLKLLSENTHAVYTGFTIIDNSTNTVITDFEKSNVKFKRLSDDEINEYVNSGEPMDKAGAYSIQGTASEFVTELSGDYNNVVGLPIYKLSKHLYKFLKEQNK